MTTTENVQAWSKTAGTNSTADSSINWSEGQDAATVNDSARSMMAAVKKFAEDQGGALVGGGTANAITVTTKQVLSSAHVTDGLRLLVRYSIASGNTAAAVTFAPDGLTAAPIKRADGSALAVGSIRDKMLLDLVYNSGASEWRCANILPATALFPGAVVTLTDGASVALDASLGSTFVLTATGDRLIIGPSNSTDGQRIIIIHFASGANRTLTLASGSGAFRFGTTITATTVTTSGKFDYIECIHNLASNRWDVINYQKGF